MGGKASWRNNRFFISWTDLTLQLNLQSRHGLAGLITLGRRCRMLVSIIIPVLNEASTIAATLESVKALCGEKEVIIVDGGSTDGTKELVATSGFLIVPAPRGRARQMNIGVQHARGAILLFLHSDSRLQPDALEKMRHTLQNTKVVGGGFQLVMDDASPVLKMVCFFSNVRARWGHVYFGDQGIFVRRNVFEEVGGFPDIAIMEDWELSRRLTRLGTLQQVTSTITTSSRRFRQWGIWRTIWLMQKLKLLYLCGVPPATIKDYYRDVR
jgi:rSAM/selenodomain-associated transferase 2